MKRLKSLIGTVLIVLCFSTQAFAEGIIYYVNSSAADQGAASAQSIKALVDAIGEDKQITIKCSRSGSGNTTAYTLTTSITIPSNIAFEIEHGAILDGAGTLTINGPFKGNSPDCFGESITVVFGGSIAANIDDTAGNGDTDKVWSANKSYDELELRCLKTDYVINTDVLAPTGSGANLSNIPLDGDFALDGIMTRTAAGIYTTRTITGTTNEITVTNGDGDAGNPTISLPTKTKWVTQTLSLDDAGVLTPTANYRWVKVRLTGNDSPTGITISEASAFDGQNVWIVNSGATTITIADVGGEHEFSGTVTMVQDDSILIEYDNDRWKEKARSTVDFPWATFSTTETEYIPISYMIDGASAPDALETITSGTDKADVRTFAGTVGDEDVLFTWQVPLDCDVTSGIKFRVINFVTADPGPSAETWQFELQGFSLGDGDALDGTLGTAQTSNSGSRTDAQYDRVATTWSSAMTSTHITGLAVGETVTFKLCRDIDDTDDYEQLIGAAGVELKYKRDHDATF